MGSVKSSVSIQNRMTMTIFTQWNSNPSDDVRWHELIFYHTRIDSAWEKIHENSVQTHACKSEPKFAPRWWTAV